MKRRIILLATMITAAAGSVNAQQVNFVDDFNAYTVGNFSTTNGWEVNVPVINQENTVQIKEDNGNKMLSLSNIETTDLGTPVTYLRRPIPYTIGQNHDTYTLKTKVFIKKTETGENYNNFGIALVKQNNAEFEINTVFPVFFMQFTPASEEKYLIAFTFKEEEGSEVEDMIILDMNEEVALLIDSSEDKWYNMEVILNYSAKTMTVKIPELSLNVVHNNPALSNEHKPTDIVILDYNDKDAPVTETLWDDISYISSDSSGNASVEAFSEAEFSVYPNPSKDVLNITSEKLDIEAVYLVDTHGRQVKHQVVNGQTATVDVQDLSTGVYFVKIVTNKGVYSVKRIKE